MTNAQDPFAAGEVDYRPFAHLSGEKVARYRRLLGVFTTAKDSFVVHLRPEDVAAALDEAPSDSLVAELDALEHWGNLRTTPDTSRVTTVDEFRRRRKLYALTPAGEAAEAALATYAATLARRAELQAVALGDIRERLQALRRLAEADEPDPARTVATLRDLETVFRGLADNATAFMASMTRSIDSAAEGVEGFLAYKDRLIGYLERFIGDLVVASADIARLLATIDDLGAERLFAAAARRQARDAAPGEDGGDGDDPVAAAEVALREGWRIRWDGLQRWFVGRDGQPSQAELLRSRARSAIPDLLEAVAELHERRAGRSDRSADFRTLARWFAEAPSDDDAHRLWRVAFGLSPARHLTVEAAVLDARREDPVPPSTPWADAAPVEVTARLRRTGRYQRRGRVVVEDRSGARAALAALLAAERAELDAARRRLASGRSQRLSELELDPDTFPLFLRLLGDALGAADAAGCSDVTSSDGSLRVELVPTDDGAVAEIATPDGVLRGRDHVVRITDLLAVDRPVP